MKTLFHIVLNTATNTARIGARSGNSYEISVFFLTESGPLR